MAVSRDEILAFCDEYLQAQQFDDKCYNGLQIEGSAFVDNIVTGVSFSQQLLTAAVERGAQMIIVHHGFFLTDIPSPFRLAGLAKKRVQAVLQNDISLVGYHLPLDSHPVIGNNIGLVKVFNLTNVRPFEIGFIGDLENEMKFVDFCQLVDKMLGTKSFSLAFGKPTVKTIAIVSGGASGLLEKVSREGVDVFLCGDVREDVVRKTEELGMNFINAGHYNTEKLGVQKLGELLAEKFKISVEFIDIPCEV